MTLTLFLLFELGIVHINNHRDFWMNNILNSFLVSRIISVRVLFFWTFCKKIQRFSGIMLDY